ncbi:MAG: MFS transporter [Ardenticatenaceae bacterium]|nr:MFS transporter [Ardenticatenaceae bacterium]
MKIKRQITGTRGFYTILAGQLVSTIGSGMTRFGLGVWVLAETGDTAAFTTLLFFAVFPIGLGSLFAGPLIDRWNRRTVMIVGNVVASLSTVIIAIFFFTDTLMLWHLYVALFINGIANAFILPTLQSITPLLVPRESLNRASGLNQLVRAMESIVAPGLAGFLVALFGLGAVFIVDFVTFGASIIALVLTAVPQPQPKAEPLSTASFWQDFAFGFQYIRQRPGLVYLLSLFSLTLFLLPGVGYSLVTPLVLSFTTEEVLGLILSSYGVGSIVGGMLMALWSSRFRRMHGILAAMATAGLAAILISLDENPWLIGAGFFLTGISFVFIVGLNRVIWQLKTAPEVQGRIFALQAAIGVGGQSLGILIAGQLASRVFEPLLTGDGALVNSVGALIGSGPGRGMAFIFLLIGLLQLVVVLVSSLMPSLRLLEDKMPDVAFEEMTVPAGQSAT